MLIDLHNHTSLHSWDSSLSPDETIQLSKERGLDGIVFTEHDHDFGFEEAKTLSKKHNFLVFAGIEINVEDGHVLVFGLKKFKNQFHNYLSLEHEIITSNGAWIAQHPYRRWKPHPVVLQTSEWDNDNENILALQRAKIVKLFSASYSMDVLNGRTDRENNQFSLDLAEELGMFYTASADTHEEKDVGKVATYFPTKIHNYEMLIEEIKLGHTWPVDLTKGSLTNYKDFCIIPSDAELNKLWQNIKIKKSKINLE
ncbi:MAG: putative metal-dependent phosphoesterase TrpH, contains PHP domain [Chloroflexi bacterium]|jgi:histidinol phosphatase-like PHP family hydrolase|nr:MAG: putative metal-dependent phosphoesterase TrpH, contains PHP domain [Chloroflexota bacterium]|tara:strand:- start:6414 stop:7178 length:765 start_codon:yes stop_codon:yes gene_type:complete